MAATASDLWHVRGEGATGDGHAIDLAQLGREIADGVWDPADQVRDPRTGRWTLIGDHPRLEEFLPTGGRLRPSTGDDPDMDITPMIDVTFQLIIFFMITATFVVQKTIDMPQAEAADEASRSNPTWTDVAEQYIVVEVRGNRTVTVDGEPAGAADLVRVLREVTRRRAIVEMAMHAHDDVPHELVVKVLDAAAGAQIEKVHWVRSEAPSGGDAASANPPRSSP
jgi:biopolymer transport protein ExbD